MTEVKSQIVAFEGLDASGKSTQVRLLCDWLSATAVPHCFLSFPRTEGAGFGETIARFLRGEFGTVGTVSPHLLAALFAADRLAAKPELCAAVSSKKLIVIDRYVYSNVAFQCAKVKDEAEKKRLASWIIETEFGGNGLPRADLVIVFDVPLSFVGANVQGRAAIKRAYLANQLDIHENSLALQRGVAEEYRRIATEDPSVKVVNCADSVGNVRSANAIFEDVRQLVMGTELSRGSDSCHRPSD